jgi:SAM-dependent methyltransferase
VSPERQSDPVSSGDAPSNAQLHAMAEHLGISVWTPAPGRDHRGQRIARAARESLRNRLPPRYATDTWDMSFRPRLDEVMAPGLRVLDVGAGARPMVAPEDRPADCVYEGLDLDADELRKAPEGSYDAIHVGDITKRQPDLVGQFDLVLSWLTMEHVKPVPAALENLGSYQRPGGRFLGYLAGAFSMHAVLNRVVPHTLARRVMRRTLGREPDTVFRAHYDHCWQTALEEIASGVWPKWEIVPLFTGGWYLSFSPALRAPFLAYEEWAYTGGHANLAAYYLIDAVA